MDLAAKLLPYDLYERHWATAHLLAGALGRDVADTLVIDVGGRIELFDRFFHAEVISVNVDGSGHLIGSGTDLPVKSSSVTAVVSIDTIEHFPVEKRADLLRECCRIAQRLVLIVAPFGSPGHIEHERRLNSDYKSITGRHHQYLSEHVLFGLPDLSDLADYAELFRPATVRCYFAGDYVREGRTFERSVPSLNKPRMFDRALNLYCRVRSMALFQPVRLRSQPYARANRFYMLVDKGNI